MIDKFTDGHPVIRQATKIFRVNHGKYAPVVTDLIWDYILIKFWDQFVDLDLDTLILEVYQIITERHDLLPDKLKKNIHRMVADDFISRYKTLDGVRISLAYMDRRTKFPSRFVDAIEDYRENQYELDQLFKLFFPQLQTEVANFCMNA